jgi:dihydrofolate reductase
MAQLMVFQQITLDGYFTGANGDLSWTKQHPPDPDFMAWTESNARNGGVLVFGRVTYDMMAGFWPSAQAMAMMPDVARQMNALPKVVFSRSMKKAEWSNTRVASGDIVAELRKMKQDPGPGMVIMGSGSIVAQLATENVIDAYQLVIFPIVLGQGRTMFEGVNRKLTMKLTGTRSFKNGIVVADYQRGTFSPRPQLP